MVEELRQEFAQPADELDMDFFEDDYDDAGGGSSNSLLTRSLIPGVTPVQALILAILLFLDVAVIGLGLLVVTQKMRLPFF